MELPLFDLAAIAAATRYFSSEHLIGEGGFGPVYKAWLLWDADRSLELMDTSFKDSCVEPQVQRCIQVGLLCVQNLLEDRPSMSSVVFMLGNDEAKLPQPKKPGFFVERGSIDKDCASRIGEFHTDDVATITILEAR
ncbi:hypothetical protein Vadar_026040 [Vaccinium darrowii]|uniref:Uncharacterized protein n=1 Tax=Vaccinium darrowii TaxID=229202 RepID=A0ACB7XT89_9ERIC|nr:hypothetical protein Vadar_026040 [Vaccinium darrowii]